jgi:hypothetical protein
MRKRAREREKDANGETVSPVGTSVGVTEGRLDVERGNGKMEGNRSHCCFLEAGLGLEE